jgi:hypothetical protein
MIGAIEDGVRVPTRAASADSRRRHHRSAAGSDLVMDSRTVLKGNAT